MSTLDYRNAALRGLAWGARRQTAALLSLVLLLGLAAQEALAQAVRTNPGFSANAVARNDDLSFPTAVPIGFEINFFGETFSTAWVNNNGNITFGGPLSTFTPQGLISSPLRIIAPFWADVDTRGSGSALVTFGQDVVNGRPAFGVNWVDVGYFSSHDDKLNSFQLVLIDRSDINPGDFDIEFNYNRIVWETGDASGGSGGFGGVPASAGYSNGTGKPEGSFEILGSRQSGAFLDSTRTGLIHRTLNSNVRGRLVFFVRSGEVDCTFSILNIDEPFPFEGGIGIVQVAAPGSCEWTAVSNSSFLTVLGETTRFGSGNVEFEVAENRGRPARTGTLTIAGHTVTVQQEGFITLNVTPPVVNVSAVDGTFPSRIALRVEAIRDPVSWSASVNTLDIGGGSWQLRLLPSAGVASIEAPATLILEVSSGFLPPSLGLAEIVVTDVVNGPSLTVPVVLGASQQGPRLQLSQSSFVFRATQGAAAPGPQPLTISNSGTDSLNWSISPDSFSSAPWLSFSQLTGTAAVGAPLPSTTSLFVDPSGLASGVYQVSVPVSASGALNDPQLISVTLQVAAADAAPAGDLSPDGLVFVSRQGLAAPAPQTLTVSNLGSGQLTFDLFPATQNGGNWLNVSPAGGLTQSGIAAVEISANPAGLPLGTYRGVITGFFSAGAPQTVEVALHVLPLVDNPLISGAPCTAQGLSLLSTSVTDQANFSLSVPVPLNVRLTDACGRPVNNASIIVDVEGNAILLQPSSDGNYTGTWTPAQETSTRSVKFTVLHPNFGGIERTFTVSVGRAPNDQSLPSITPDGVVEAASFTRGWPLAPGSIVSIFGANLASEEAFAPGLPLPRELGGVSVRIGDEDVPLFYVSPTQINAQVPFSVRPGEVVSVVVNSNGRLSAPQNYLIFPVRPGIFLAGGFAAALDSSSNLITSQSPVRPGDVIQVFATGLGLVNPAAETGAPAPPSSVVETLTATLAGIQLPVVYQGLAPGFAGLYQVNIIVPSNFPSGDWPLIFTQRGVPSNPDAPALLPLRRPGE